MLVLGEIDVDYQFSILMETHIFPIFYLVAYHAVNFDSYCDVDTQSWHRLGHTAHRRGALCRLRHRQALG